jgi:hypothetical protein
MKIGNPSQRPDKATKMKKETIGEMQRISKTTPTGEREARDAVVHVLPRADLKIVIIIVITIVTDTTETDTPGREARPPADSDGQNAKLKKLNED